MADEHEETGERIRHHVRKVLGRLGGRRGREEKEGAGEEEDGEPNRSCPLHDESPTSCPILPRLTGAVFGEPRP